MVYRVVVGKQGQFFVVEFYNETAEGLVVATCANRTRAFDIAKLMQASAS